MKRSANLVSTPLPRTACSPLMETAAESRRRQLTNIACRSIRGLVLSERCLELLHDGVRISAGLLDVVDPLLLQRFGRLLPFIELRVGDGEDLVSRQRLHFLQAGALVIRPRI